MKRPNTRLLVFACLMPACQLVINKILVTLAAMFISPNTVAQLFIALPYGIIILLFLPRWLYRVLVAQPANLAVPSRSRIFASCAIVFLVSFVAILSGILEGIITPFEGVIVYCILSFFGHWIIASWLWSKLEHTAIK